MNWETYNSMTEKQRKEYDYRFGSRPYFDWKTMIVFVAFMAVVTLFMMVVIFLVYADEDLIDTREAITELALNMNNIFRAVSILISVILFGYVTSIIYYIVGRHLWMKENKITKVKGKNWFKDQVEEWLK